MDISLMTENKFFEFQSIDSIIEESKYYETPGSFFGLFPKAFKDAQHQILKLETRQEYLEPGNPSFEMMVSGDFSKAIDLIPEMKASDDEIYSNLKQKGVDFVRCRPIEYPFTSYLKWELETYKYSAEKGERIFCCLLKETKQIFENFATKDFMVFDNSIAFIHNYDEKGLIQGGWITQKPQHILSLQSLFINIKSQSSPFTQFVT
jgi:hypothetical protein